MTATTSSASCRRLRLVLGDQLNHAHSWYDSTDPDTLYLVVELLQETAYVRHHVQKLCAFFAAMAAFADGLREHGHAVLHLTLDQSSRYRDLPELILALCERYQVETFEYQAPDEYRLRRQLREFDMPTGVARQEYDSEHFLLPQSEFESWIKPGRHNRLESFYRRMRKRLDLLMDGDQPRGGQWNYDHDNRNKLKPADLAEIPPPRLFANDVGDIVERLERHGVDHFGRVMSELPWPVDRDQALELLDYFVATCLPRFGRFQDAMTARHEHAWSLYHSRLSFALNSKLLHPREVVDAAITAFDADDSAIDIAQVEGFVRQVIGWREYVRAVYWVNMPAYAERNQLDARRDLPAFFWTGETRMNCMRHALGQSLDWAYAHHIQRLMITGNFCLLAGIAPDQVDAWYLGIYVDAIEWVEMPNTRGMSQFADGGLIATKPYCAGGNYINKMSDYCGGCHYDVRAKTGERACPFNSLYWDFMLRHRERLATNPRIGVMYRNWDRQDEEVRSATLARARDCIDNLEKL
ncbi:MAG: cryptochrome/photolyase family protein [Gammaproteobacteria bacterium]|nr:cryptochrome/photolyase family protein [Gammaproteobacteria bacterium]